VVRGYRVYKSLFDVCAGFLKLQGLLEDGWKDPRVEEIFVKSSLGVFFKSLKKKRGDVAKAKFV
jgi:hypothetical protein